MLNKINVNHSAIFFTGLVIIVISLPFSQFSLSVGQFVVLGNWLLEGKFKKKYFELISNKAALVLLSFYLLHVLGLIYTTDFNYALKDLRVKLPLLALPVIFATTRPLTHKRFNILLWLFVSASFVSTLIGYGILLFSEVIDVREMSPFISHIRLSLIISISIFISGYFIYKKRDDQLKIRILLSLLMVWFIVYLIFSESATGIYVVLGTSFGLVIWGFSRIKSYRVRLSVIIITLVIPLGLVIFLYTTATNYLTPHKNDLKNLEEFTADGNPYSHEIIQYTVENGSYFGLYICESELREAWNKRSKLDYEGKDEQGQVLKITLIRYLNSLDQRKDALGMERLNDQDISNIEQGKANFHYTKRFDPRTRIYKFLWEYQALRRGDNPKGLSLVQRLEYWRAAAAIIQAHFWMGVGTGDMDEAFRVQYEKMNTKLPMELRHRSHNQFLAIFTAFGLLGFVWFLFSLLYPPIHLKTFRNFLYVSFFIIITLSMFFEDTIETQMGATLFAFFNSLFLFVGNENSPESHSRRKL
jgi:hypothetical protein